jgi:hypothetical protein
MGCYLLLGVYEHTSGFSIIDFGFIRINSNFVINL